MDLLFVKNSIRMHSGVYVNAVDIDSSSITIEDIAHHLARNARWNGATHQFYSVARHSVFVANMLPDEHKLAGLLHDASEAYITDIPKPYKELLPDYQILEDRFMKIIAEKFSFEYPLNEIVKNVDHIALEYEWENIILNDNIEFNGFRQDEELFLSTYNNIIENIKEYVK